VGVWILWVIHRILRVKHGVLRVVSRSNNRRADQVISQTTPQRVTIRNARSAASALLHSSMTSDPLDVTDSANHPDQLTADRADFCLLLMTPPAFLMEPLAAQTFPFQQLLDPFG
jgi:hypothetical protein